MALIESDMREFKGLNFDFHFLSKKAKRVVKNIEIKYYKNIKIKYYDR